MYRENVQDAFNFITLKIEEWNFKENYQKEYTGKETGLERIKLLRQYNKIYADYGNDDNLRREIGEYRDYNSTNETLKNYSFYDFVSQYKDDIIYGYWNIVCENWYKKLTRFLNDEEIKALKTQKNDKTASTLQATAKVLESRYEQEEAATNNWSNEELNIYIPHYLNNYEKGQNEEWLMHTKYNGDARKALYELRQIYYRDKLSDDYGFTDLSKIITQQDNESMKGTKLKQKYE